MSRSSFLRAERGLDRVAAALTWVGGLCLLGIVVLVSVGVVMRYGVGAPILGVNEIVQLTAVVLVMAALPYCTSRGGHVNVDVFDAVLGPRGRLFGDLLSRLVAGVALGFLCYRAMLKALDALEWGDATNMLSLPIWPVYGILALGAGLCALVYALQMLVLLSGGRRP